MPYGYICFWKSHNWFNSVNHQNGHRISSRRPSSATSRATEQYGEPQVIHAVWIDEARLKEILNRRYGNNYRLLVSISDLITTARADHVR